MTTHEQLLRAAETCQHDALCVLADHAEECGEQWLAAGWRCRAGHLACSARHRQKHWGMPGADKSTGLWYGWRGCGAGFSHDVGGAVFQRLKGGKPRRMWRRWDTPQAALLAAAHAAGEVLKRKAEKDNQRKGEKP